MASNERKLWSDESMIAATSSVLQDNLGVRESARLLGSHGSASLCRVERENKMAATYNVLAFKR